jgi:hypothetical protein
MQLKEAADSVLGRMQTENPTYSFDPAIIALIIEAIKELLPLFIDQCSVQAREVPAAAAQIASRTTIRDRIRWRSGLRELRREIGRHDFHVAGGVKLYTAMLDQAASTSGEEVEDLWCCIR